MDEDELREFKEMPLDVQYRVLEHERVQTQALAEVEMHRIWALFFASIVLSVIWALTAIFIVDRVGPVRPIVTMTQSYQAK